jgi:uncharacterized repeat protein (TIGR03803 family)
MRGKSFFASLKLALAILIVSLCAIPAHAATYKILHQFNDHRGFHPYGVIIGPDGNIYGVTVLGGFGGNAYELTPGADGHWLETRMLAFTRKGFFPNPLLFDSAGNLLGTEEESGPDYPGCGALFELNLEAAGNWEESLLDVFNCSVTLYPQSALVQDGAGNLYGTSWGSSEAGSGSVFELSPVAGGGWNLSALHIFSGPDGDAPMAALAIDASGNLYGTTLCGGTFPEVKTPDFRNCNGNEGPGTVWELSPQGGGNWKFTTLYDFTGHADGGNPSAGGPLIFDSAGNLYGTTHNGGAHNLGTTFELSPNADGTWSETVLHSFSGPDGVQPSGGVVSDAAGNLYGETFGRGSYLGIDSGAYAGGQTVYELSPNGDGTWAETVLHTFNDPVSGGPAMGLTMDGAGNLYGTTWLGGVYSNGTVFEITP